MQVSGALAVVTGASSGIGAALAVALADRGAHVLGCGRDEAALRGIAARTGGEWLAADLADRGQVLHLAAQLRGHSPDILVHNAGIGLAGPLEQAREDDIDRVSAVNLLAPVLLTRALLPAMRSRGRGRLVFVGSIAGLLGVGGEAVYAASKAGLTVFGASLRAELAGTGVGVTTVAPGVVATDFFARRGQPYPRRVPRPVTAEHTALRVVRAVERDLDDVVVPRWLRLPTVLRAAAPQTYDRLAAHWS